MSTRPTAYGAGFWCIDMNKNEMFYIETAKLKLNPKNPRKNDGAVDTVMKSIEKYGFKNPLIADSNLVVYCGNTRLKAAKNLDLKEVPVIIADDLTPEQIREFAIIDNKSSEIAEWDFELLNEELAELSLEDFDFDWGKSEKDNKQIVEDEPPEQNEEGEPTVKLGEIWQLGRHRLICGDSTNAETVARLMDGEQADMVFTDPPYGINAVDKNGKIASGKICKPGIYKPIIGDNSTDMAEKAYPIIKELCDKQMIWGGNYFLKFLPFSDGWLIWDKREDTCKNDFSDGEMAWCSFHTPLRIYHQLWNGMIRKGESGKRYHPSQKPIKLLADILKDFTSDNDLIVDIFGGSGSTLIACEQLNRTCYMAELDPRYCDVIIKRWENLTGKTAVKL